MRQHFTALAAKYRELFEGYKIVESRGSFSVVEDGEVIAKIIPKRDVVFVGIRQTRSPERWFSGPLDRVSVNRVTFCGVHVPVEHPDDAQLAMLVRSLSRLTDLDG